MAVTVRMASMVDCFMVWDFFPLRPLVENPRIRGEGGREKKRASGASNGGTAKRLKGKADRGRAMALRRALFSF